mgnify:CR=1 FL=1|jgi:hypothetical protein
MNRHTKIVAVSATLLKTDYKALDFTAIGRGFCFRQGAARVFLKELTDKSFEDLSVDEIVALAATAEAMMAERELAPDEDEDDENTVLYSYVYTSNKPGEAEEMRSTVYVTAEGDAMDIDDHVANAYTICRVTKENTAVYVEKPHEGNPNHRNLVVRFKWSEEHQLPLYDHSLHQAKIDAMHDNLRAITKG